MKRENGALEVWLRGEEEVLLGWLADYAPFDHRLNEICIPIEGFSMEPETAGDPVLDDDIVVEHHFSLTTKVLDIDHATILAEGLGTGSTYARNVPLGAQHRYIESSNIDRYTWKVLGVDMAEYEMLFDLDQFEPFVKREKSERPKFGPMWGIPILKNDAMLSTAIGC